MLKSLELRAVEAQERQATALEDIATSLKTLRSADVDSLFCTLHNAITSIQFALQDAASNVSQAVWSKR